LSQVHNTIPLISNASVVVAFRQVVRDEKMLEKLATHNIQDVAELFSLADSCARAVLGIRHLPQRRRKQESPMRVLLLKAVAKTIITTTATTRRKIRGPVATTSRWLVPILLQLLQQRLVGAMACEMTSTLVKRSIVTMEAHGARCITPRTTTPESAEISRSSRSSSVRGSSNCAKTTRLPASGKENKRWILRRTRMRRWSSRTPRGC
jgi:hypothetical protein